MTVCVDVYISSGLFLSKFESTKEQKRRKYKYRQLIIASTAAEYSPQNGKNIATTFWSKETCEV